VDLKIATKPTGRSYLPVNHIEIRCYKKTTNLIHLDFQRQVCKTTFALFFTQI
jgi:hypothetical protein